VEVLSGVFRILACVVVVGGVTKVAFPAGFAAPLRSLGLPSGTLPARLIGSLEVGVGAAALVIAGRTGALLLAVTYACFTAVVVAARRAGAESCGCFGAVDAPPGWVHITVNAASTVVALAAIAIPPAGLLDALEPLGSAAAPYLALLALGTWLVVVVDTTGARLAEETAAVNRLGAVFRANNISGVGTPPPGRHAARPQRSRI